MVDFGWSAGCIVDAIKAANKIRKALKDAGGAKEQYTEAIAFLSQVEATFEHLKRHIEDNPDSLYREAFEHQLELIETPWRKLETACLEKYEKSLGADSTRSKSKQVPRKVQWALKSIGEAVRKAKGDILEPLQMIGTLLPLETMTSIKGFNQRIMDSLQLMGASDTLNMSILNNHAADQKASQKEILDQLGSLQQTIREQHQAVLDFVEEASLATAARAQDEETTRSIAETTSEIASCVKTIGEQLSSATIQRDVLKCELQSQQASIQAAQKDLQELLEHRKRVETLGKSPSPGKNKEASSVDWSAIGAILGPTLEDGLISAQGVAGTALWKLPPKLPGERAFKTKPLTSNLEVPGTTPSGPVPTVELKI